MRTGEVDDEGERGGKKARGESHLFKCVFSCFNQTKGVLLSVTPKHCTIMLNMGNDINVPSFPFQLDVLFGNLTEMVEFQVEFLKTLEDGTRLVPDLEKLERVDQFKVSEKQTTIT